MKSSKPRSRPKNTRPRAAPRSMRTTPRPRLSAPSTTRSATWASRVGAYLEPSMGVGNFFGLLPESMAHSELHGVELDSITGRIARQLYPEAKITVAGFETTNRPASMTSPWATCRLATTRSLTPSTTGSVSQSTTTLPPRCSTRCVRAASSRL